MDKVTEKKIKKYLDLTKKAIAGVEIVKDKGPEWEQNALKYLDMANRYYSDSKFYREKGDLVTSFAAVNYAHAWIDAGVMIGLFVAEKDSESYIMPKE